MYSIEANQNLNQKSDHASANLVKVLGSYTSVAIYSNRFNSYTKHNQTKQFQINVVLLNNSKHKFSLENNPSSAVILDYNSNKTIFNYINAKHFSNVSQFHNNYNKSKKIESKNLEANKSKEKTNHYHGLQNLESETKKNQNNFNPNSNSSIDSLGLNFQAFKSLSDKLNPKGNKVKTLKINLLNDSSDPNKSKQLESKSFYSQNNTHMPVPKIEFANQEKLKNLSLNNNEDHLEGNELDDILSVPQIEAVTLGPYVQAVNMNMDQYVIFGQLNQAVNWTPLFQAVSWKTHDQAVKSGPSNSAVNWDRQDQQQISGKIQC